MFNLMRQLGGSLGIAIMATMLARLTRVEKAVLTEHAGAYDPATAERLGAVTRGLMSRGNDAATAKPQALLLLDGQIGARAGVMAFSRIYLVSGILLVCALPLLLLWRTGRTAGRVSVDGHRRWDSERRYTSRVTCTDVIGGEGWRRVPDPAHVPARYAVGVP
jgi:DHA2 family multidrug resistance protein